MDANGMQATPDQGGNPQQGGMSNIKRRFSRYMQNPSGGGHQQPPGNEPGGANGQYGGFGQTPGMQPSVGFNQAIDSVRRGFSQSPAGQIVNGLHQRYGQQGQMDHAMNKNQSMMRSQAAGMGSFMNDDVQGDAYGSTPPQVEPQQQQPTPDQQPQQAQQGGFGSYQPSSTMSGTPPPMPQGPQAQTETSQPADDGMVNTPFGKMKRGAEPGQPQAMKHGGMVTKPTLALIGEDGPEAVVPMSGRGDANITPGMMQPRDTFQTGQTSLHHPLHGLKPSGGEHSNWKRYNAMHPRA